MINTSQILKDKIAVILHVAHLGDGLDIWKTYISKCLSIPYIRFMDTIGGWYLKGGGEFQPDITVEYTW